MLILYHVLLANVQVSKLTTEESEIIMLRSIIQPRQGKARYYSISTIQFAICTSRNDNKPSAKLGLSKHFWVTNDIINACKPCLRASVSDPIPKLFFGKDGTTWVDSVIAGISFRIASNSLYIWPTIQLAFPTETFSYQKQMKWNDSYHAIVI